ncbi:MAG: hypothetical protein Kow00105_17890 [Phycisphaeraceae bacterium]
MSPRKKDHTPPYEIMGRAASPQASGHRPQPGAGSGFGRRVGGAFESVMDTWRASASEPITLRVTRGMALCAVLAVFGLIVLGYWVGYSRGGTAAEKRVRAEYEPAVVGLERQPPIKSNGTGMSLSPPNDGQKAVGGGTTADLNRGDPRVPGLNYLILALYPPEEAERLRAFLAQHQVEVMIGPRNNKGLCQVIALTGFTREQMRDTDAAERFLARMRQLGREWKAANGGRGDDLSSMYFHKYEPPLGR